ncbi:c-type cytochrome [Dongia rigui]|uniref:C-type cytochrome n=1 Tax=Dongia rigui TaxID=940149 RepID=A0ABU5E5V8_9PROT|nr:c-type cytochrome [Dongia rigui]MDY0874338.1 c-type cytochrome [Dongia rigui]
MKVGFAVAAVSILAAFTNTATADDQVARGAYLASIMDCGGCHNTGAFTPKPNVETPLAGSDIGFEVPGLGVFYPANLTPDKKTGLGAWSDAEIIAAFTTGLRPDGRQLAPAMPWMSYGHITKEDAASLVAYLRSLKPVEHQVPGPFGAQEKATAPYMTVKMP